ncbi:DUF1254 domain-containing protein [Halosquirtibacter xylanolyticus]|uniref:DUF1254 domain-containing protein n=1 Tax=Halosquirtibacter xylanolyticus TaxID=3374599 RepID=UPI00374827DE|nr:DUF1254 domain-containing protein [Prolixibacteraceae bacterium]
MKRRNYLILFFCFVMMGCSGMKKKEKESASTEVNNESLKDIAYEAFVYAYPMIEQVKTVNTMNKAYGKLGLGPNKVYMGHKYPMDNIGQPIVAPNFTSMTGLINVDISGGPVTLQIPDITDRYAVFQCIDVFTYNFFYIGSRATKGKGGKFIFHNKNQQVQKVGDVTPVLVEQDIFSIVNRIDVKDRADVANVVRYQNQVKIIDKPATTRSYPTYDKIKVFSPDFVDYVNQLIVWIPEPEKEMYQRFAKIGIKSDVKLTADQRKEVQVGIDAAYKAIMSTKKQLQVGNGWTGATTIFGTREYINGRYLDLAAGASFGLWGNSKEEANYYILFAEGAGELTFTKEQLPPLSDIGFYSLTIYDSTVHATRNKYNSYVLTHDRMKFNKDGSITFKVSKKPQKGNWLYLPTYKFALLLRVYAADPNKIQDYVPPRYSQKK